MRVLGRLTILIIFVSFVAPALPSREQNGLTDAQIKDILRDRIDVAKKIIHEGDRMFAQATGQERLELFAETETDFFLQAVDAQLTFIKDDKGQVTHAVLHQSKVDQKAVRIK